MCRWPYEPWDCGGCGRTVERQPPSCVPAGLVCDECLDRGRRGEPFIPLTVQPVAPKARPEGRPIVAVCLRDWVVLTESGELFDLDNLPNRIRELKQGEQGRAGRVREAPEQLPPAIVVTDAAADLVAFLDNSVCADSPLWQWQLALRAPSAWRPEAQARPRAEFLTPRPVRFGYASRRGKARRAEGRARWYELIDMLTFCELPDGWGQPDVSELLRFGKDLRDWANSVELPVLPCASAFGSRLLRDARFGGGWRRKIPAATNRRLRSYLPGNHYQLLGATGLSYPEVHKWDQEAAHHHAALVTTFPHPDRLDAHGWFRRPPPPEKRIARGRGAIPGLTPQWQELIAQPGLFIVAVHVPAGSTTGIDSLMIPQLRHTGTHWRALTSAEIQHVRDLKRDGFRVGLGDIWACWTSPEVDERPNEYAAWALEQPRDGRPWVKPALLAAYGLLAARPRRFRNAWRWCRQPDGAIGFQTRQGELVGWEKSSRREREPGTANMLARILIESRVRLDSLSFARQLRAEGLRPICVYADAVFATGPILHGVRAPVPWRYEGTVHDLTFDSPARYRSREETRLPGTPGGRNGLQRAMPREGVIINGKTAAAQTAAEQAG